MIIEAALLTDDEKITACTLAKAAGADYVKTSTGFGPGGATAADVALMRRVVGAEMGVKAAGGVRDLDGLKAMVAAGRDARRRQRRREDRAAGARREADRHRGRVRADLKVRSYAASAAALTSLRQRYWGPPLHVPTMPIRQP